MLTGVLTCIPDWVTDVELITARSSATAKSMSKIVNDCTNNEKYNQNDNDLCCVCCDCGRVKTLCEPVCEEEWEVSIW